MCCEELVSRGGKIHATDPENETLIPNLMQPYCTLNVVYRSSPLFISRHYLEIIRCLRHSWRPEAKLRTVPEKQTRYNKGASSGNRDNFLYVPSITKTKLNGQSIPTHLPIYEPSIHIYIHISSTRILSHTILGTNADTLIYVCMFTWECFYVRHGDTAARQNEISVGR